MLSKARILFTLLITLSLFSSIRSGATAGFTPSSTTGCSPQAISFTNTSTSGSSYYWDFDNGATRTTTSTSVSPSTTYLSPGTYHPRIVVTYSSGAKDSFTTTITIYAKPTVSFTGDVSGCVGTPVNFTDGSTLGVTGSGTYNWDFGDGGTSASKNPSHTYSKSGNFTITLTVTNSVGCTSFLQKTAYVTIHDKPTPSFYVDTPVLCGPSATASFENNSSGTPTPFTYLWRFGDGGTSTATSPTHSYSGYGTYTVTLIATSAAGCVDSIVKAAVILTSETAGFTLSDTAICAGSKVFVKNTSTPSHTSTSWSFGDGGTATSDTATYSYHTAGTYRLTITSHNGTCVDTTGKTVHVYPLPVVDFSDSVAQPCPAPQTIYFTNLTTGASTYNWRFEHNTSISTATNPSHYYSSSMVDSVVLIAHTSFGCVDSVKHRVAIYPLNVTIVGNSDYDSTQGCNTLTVSFYDFAWYSYPISLIEQNYPYSTSTWSWDFGDGTTSTSATPTHTFTTSFRSRYIVRLTITTSNGCSQTAVFIVKVGTKPTARIKVSDSVICANRNMTFFDSSTNANGYYWDFGNGVLSSDSTAQYKYPMGGIDTVIHIVYNNGCPSDTVKRILIVDSPANVWGYRYVCDTFNEIRIVNQTKGATSFQWMFGDGTYSTLSDTVIYHLYPGVGSYNDTLIAISSRTGCRDTQVRGVNIINPVASFTTSTTALCRFAPVSFTGLLTGGIAMEYNWYFDGGAKSIAPGLVSETISYNTRGYHSTKIKIADQRNYHTPWQCYDTASKYLYIAVPDPQIKFGATPTAACLTTAIVFTDSSTDLPGFSITNRAWDFGDATSSSTTSVSISKTYSAAGNYDIQLIATDNIGCSDTFTKKNYIHIHNPVAAFSPLYTAVCQGQGVRFANFSTGNPQYNYWSFGDGDTSEAFSPTNYYNTVGKYTVKLVIKDSIGCMDSLTKPLLITVVGKPHAAFSVNDSFSLCTPLDVKFFDKSSGSVVSYNWDFDDPASGGSSFASPGWTYTNPGNYKVMQVVTNAFGCTDTAYKQIMVLGFDGLLNYGPEVGCEPLTVKFKTPVIGFVPIFIYDFGDGSTLASTLDSTTHTYTHPGMYIPKIIFTDSITCASSSKGFDTIKVAGVDAGYLSLPNPVCDSGTFELIDTSKGIFTSISSELWLFDDGTSATGLSVYRTYHAPGSYKVVLIQTTSAGCTDTLTNMFVVHPHPDVKAGPDTTVCVGDNAMLTASGAATYVWAPAATLSCATCQTTSAKPTTATKYIVVGTDKYGCKHNDTVEVFLKTNTTATTDSGGQICQGDYIQLFDSAGPGATYTWIPASGLDNSHIYDPKANPSSTTKYMVIAQVGSCIPDTAYVNVIVHPKPAINAGQDQTIVAGSSAQLDATGSGFNRLSWAPNASLNCDSCYDPLATPTKTTMYRVIAFSDYGCEDSSHVTIYVICDHSQLYMPNTFTPNGDGQNDLFYPHGKGLTIIKRFSIYDRWGELIFHRENINANDKDAAWDGRFRGVLLNPDVFVYVVDVICETGEPMSIKGNVSLIR